ncbi:Unknown protein [Striga hermonthica]|uniref:Uncharacterized protein n=1 Tax=Striga hermonthica TaxID=68872 RepID=A0A9N7N521_STRHE|nr:Unknown protein [Striga hermonthica]
MLIGEDEQNEDSADDLSFIDCVETSDQCDDELSFPMIPKLRKPRADKGRRSWSQQEEEVLIAALKGIITTGWKSENGFKMGFLNILEQELVKQLSGTDLQASNVNLSSPSRTLSEHMEMNDVNMEEEVNETMSESTQPSSTRTKKSVGRKRKSGQSFDPLCEVMKNFAEKTGARLEKIAQRIGNEYDVSSARKDVYSIVREIEGLNLQEQLLISKILVKNIDELDLFFSLDNAARVEIVRIKLAGGI